MTSLIVSVGIAMLSAATDGVVAADGFSKSVIQEAHANLNPAMCHIRYSMEITNPSNGEVSHRAGNSLGLMVSADGLVLAHGHLQLENRHPENIKVKVGDDDDTEYDAVILKKPDDINVTFLRLELDEPTEFPFVRFSENADLELGESVLLFGLLRESLDYARGLQIRRVGAVLEEPRKTYILDESTAFGYVGGPVINTDGELLGVLGFDLSSAEGGDIYTRSGHPLVFHAELFRDHIDNPPSEDTVSEDAWLGVFTQPLTEQLAEYWGLPDDGGVVVSTVLPGSPADRSGFKMGDVIVNFDGNAITARQDQDVAAFTKLVRESVLGEPLNVEFLREGEPMEIRLTLLPRPKSGRDALELEDPIFGLTVREITTDARIVMNLAEDVEGVIVRRVKSGSPAAIAGIRPTYIVMTVAGRPIRTVQDYAEAIEEEAKLRASEIRMFCRVGANTAFFRIQPRWDD